MHVNPGVNVLCYKNTKTKDNFNTLVCGKIAPLANIICLWKPKSNKVYCVLYLMFIIGLYVFGGNYLVSGHAVVCDSPNVERMERGARSKRV